MEYFTVPLMMVWILVLPMVIDFDTLAATRAVRPEVPALDKKGQAVACHPGAGQHC